MKLKIFRCYKNQITFKDDNLLSSGEDCSAPCDETMFQVQSVRYHAVQTKEGCRAHKSLQIRVRETPPRQFIREGVGTRTNLSW